MMIMNHPSGDRDLSHLAINLVIRPGQAFLDCGRVSDDLESGARLVSILERSIRPALFGVARWLVGIESWSIRERQDVTAQRIHDDGRSRLCVAPFDCRKQCLLGA